MSAERKASIPDYARKKGILTIYVNEERITLLERLLAEHPESESVSQVIFRALAEGRRPDHTMANIQDLQKMLHTPADFMTLLKNEDIGMAWGKMSIAGFMRHVVREVVKRLDAEPDLAGEFSELEMRALREMEDVDIGTGVTPDQSKAIIEAMERVGPGYRVGTKKDPR